MAVDQLSPGQAHELASAWLGDSGERLLAETVAREANGNPFFIEAFIRYEHRVKAANEAGVTAALSLDRVIRARVEALPTEARRLLEVVSVSADTVDVGAALAASALGSEAVPALRMLQAHSFVRLAGLRDADAIEIYHDRIRESVVASLSSETLARHHAVLAAAMEARGADPELLAHHFLCAGQPHKGVPYALLAAERAADALAFDRAARLYQLALAGHQGAEEERRAIRLRRVDALVNGGHCAEAAPFLLEEARLAAPDTALELRRRAAELLLVAGRVEQGAELLRSVAQELDLRYPSSTRGALLGAMASLARIRLHGVHFRSQPRPVSGRDARRLRVCFTAARGLSAYDVARGAFFSFETLRLALRAGDLASGVPTLAGVGSMLAYGGAHITTKWGTGLVRDALAIAEKMTDPGVAASVRVQMGICHVTAGRWSEALATLDPPLRQLKEDCPGYQHERSWGEMTAILALEQLGRWREVSWRADACLREAEATGNLYLGVQASLYLSSCRLAEDCPQAGEPLERALDAWPAPDKTFLFQHWLGLKAATYRDLYCDDASSAYERMRVVWPKLAASSLLQIQFVRIFALQLRAGATLAMSARRSSSREPLLDDVLRMTRRLERERTPHATAAAHGVRAAVAWQQGDPVRARVDLARAAELYDRAGMTVHAAAARRQSGAWIRSTLADSLVADADELMRRQGIARPERWTAIVAPGFGREP